MGEPLSMMRDWIVSLRKSTHWTIFNTMERCFVPRNDAFLSFVIARHEAIQSLI